jgi:hypothetical protein
MSRHSAYLANEPQGVAPCGSGVINRFYMKKDLKLFTAIFGAMCLLFLVFLMFSIHRGFSKNLSYSFKGVVDSIIYDEKGTPKIRINNQEYVLNAGYNFDYQIAKGDSLKKSKESSIYTLIKQKTGKIMVFKN